MALLMQRHVHAMEDFVPYVERMLDERKRAGIGGSLRASSTRCGVAWIKCVSGIPLMYTLGGEFRAASEQL